MGTVTEMIQKSFLVTTCVSLTFEEAAEVREPEKKLYCHLLVSWFIGKMLFLLLGLMVVEPVEPRSNPQGHSGAVQLLGSRSFYFREISKNSITGMQDEPIKDLPYHILKSQVLGQSECGCSK